MLVSLGVMLCARRNNSRFIFLGASWLKKNRPHRRSKANKAAQYNDACAGQFWIGGYVNSQYASAAHFRALFDRQFAVLEPALTCEIGR